MGKGSNVQKAQQARERNQKKMGKSDEGMYLCMYVFIYLFIDVFMYVCWIQMRCSVLHRDNFSHFLSFLWTERKAASAKAAKDAVAKRCIICLQTFMVNSRPPLLYQHVVAKHPDMLSDPTRCFPELAGYDPK